MLVTFYQLKKRPNSTKTVDEKKQYWFTVDVELKEPCNTIEPSFTLELLPGSDKQPFAFPANIIESGGGVDDGLPADLTSYTHVDMHNLYFRCPIFRITSIEIENTIATIHLCADLLASYRDEILKSTQFIGRISDILKSDRTIVDALPVTENYYRFTYSATGSPVFTSGYENGSYILGVINNTPTVGGVCYYLMPSVNTLKNLFNYLYDDTFYDGITDISSELAKSLINPIQYIVSCKYFPLNLDYYEANGEPIFENIRVGAWSTPVQAFRMLDESTSIFGALPRSTHPQANSESDYLMLHPYTQHTFYLEPFGAIPVDSSYLVGVGARLAFKITVDHISGKGKLYLYRENSTNDYIGVYYADIAQDIPLHQITQNITGAIENAVSSIGGAFGSAFKMDIGGALANASGLANSISAALPQVRTSGGGTFVPFVGGVAKLFTKHTYIDETFNEEYGYICNSRRELSNCVGDWVQCPHPQLELVATEENVQKIYTLLKEGVYLE